MHAGNQFSVPLIDFFLASEETRPGWESVLRPPDRLRPEVDVTAVPLGISSPSP